MLVASITPFKTGRHTISQALQTCPNLELKTGHGVHDIDSAWKPSIVITSVREPVAQTLSCLFQDIDCTDFPYCYDADRSNIVAASTKTLVAHALRNVKNVRDVCTAAHLWEDLRRRFDFDVARCAEFDACTPVASSAGTTFLVCRLESICNDLRVLFPQAATAKNNSADDKWYSQIYEDARRWLPF